MTLIEQGLVLEIAAEVTTYSHNGHLFDVLRLEHALPLMQPSCMRTSLSKAGFALLRWSAEPGFRTETAA